MNEQPLVSIVVITYNSSKYVLETLESAKKQTYRNIELIVSDDCSTDNTVSICQEWLSNNKDSFVSVKLITSEKNTGIAPNANRGWYQARGEWVKGLAGDDKLLPNCIMDDVSYVADHPETDILFSKMIAIGDKNAAKDCYFLDVGKYFRNLNQSEFEVCLLLSNFLPAASEFIKRSCFLELDGWDESFPFIEDWPFWIKALEYKKVISFFDKETVCYRFSEDSISQANSKHKISQKFSVSSEQASQKAHQILCSKYKGAKYFCRTHETKFEGSIIGKLLHYTNIINPFYYKVCKRPK
ncbi:MAG: glycosyltransferase [Prevotella sp.]|jgi:alpha-1,3-rhamnosyltransferase|nr:glycosyltransferase [Prevotella sp.]